MKKSILPAAALLVVALLGAWYRFQAPPASAPVAVGPAVWMVEGGRAKMVLFGSFHVMKPGADWATPAVMAAFGAADALVVEIDLSRYGEDDIRQATAKYALLPKGTTLEAVLNKKAYGALLTHAHKLGVDEGPLRLFKPWFAALTLEQAELARQGYAAGAGVDETMMRRANAKGLKIMQLETFDQQLAVLASPPGGDINSYIEDYMAELDQAPEKFAQIDHMWRSGDVAGLEDYLREERDRDPASFDAVYTRRNAAWLPRFEDMLKSGGAYFVMVGAGHLVGAGGIVAGLQKAGYRVHRL